MPVNKLYPLDKLLNACLGFVNKTHSELTLEYVLIKDVNDSFKDADRLSAIARRLKAKINLIPLSPTDGAAQKTSGEKRAADFTKRVASNSVMATMRKSKGADIRAACGMLAGKGR